VKVTAIEAQVGGARLKFEAGDPLLDLPVRIGPDCKIDERNNGLSVGFAVGGYGPISDFSLSLGDLFSGASGPAKPRPDRDIRPDTTAPYAEGVENIGRATNPPWKPSDFDYPETTWEAHGIAVVADKLSRLEAEEPADDRASRIRERRLAEHRNPATASGIVGGFWFMQRYSGALDRALTFAPNPVGALAYLSRLSTIKFSADLLDFDSDCQCGTVTGTLGDLDPWPPITEALRMPVGEGRMPPAESRMPVGPR
jgi:hypothetical protein